MTANPYGSGLVALGQESSHIKATEEEPEWVIARHPHLLQWHIESEIVFTLINAWCYFSSTECNTSRAVYLEMSHVAYDFEKELDEGFVNKGNYAASPLPLINMNNQGRKYCNIGIVLLELIFSSDLWESKQSYDISSVLE